MTKKHLTIFVEVCRCLSFSQAAQAFAQFHHPEQVHGKIMLINE